MGGGRGGGGGGGGKEYGMGSSGWGAMLGTAQPMFTEGGGGGGGGSGGGSEKLCMSNTGGGKGYCGTTRLSCLWGGNPDVSRDPCSEL